MGALYITCQSWISVKLTFCCFTYLYGKIRPILSFLEYPRGKSQISTWASKNSSEVSFDSSEVSFHSSEVLFRAHVEDFLFPRGDFEISRWKSLFSDTMPFRYVARPKLL